MALFLLKKFKMGILNYNVILNILNHKFFGLFLFQKQKILKA